MIIYVNGKRHALPQGRAEATLLQFLREIGLTGAKLGCGEGGCGACTVMISSVEPDGSLLHRSINACLCPLYSVEGMHIITVEGLGNVRDGLHPVQESLAKAHGSQCGFCTPGFIMSMYSLLRSKNGQPITEEEVEENLAGNLCRCTGYRPILDAFKPFAKGDPSVYTEESLANAKMLFTGNCGTSHLEKEPSPHPSGGVPMCPSTGQPCICSSGSDNGDRDGSTIGVSTRKDKENRTFGQGLPALQRRVAEPIFPPELRLRSMRVELEVPGHLTAWHRPLTLNRLLHLKQDHPEAKLVVGNSEVGIEMKFKAARYPVLIAATHVPELTAFEILQDGVRFGASLTLTKVLQKCRLLIHSLPCHQVSTFTAVAAQLKWFAGPPIRNAASLGGNICTASPISDLNPLWMAAGATFEVASAARGMRTVNATSFFLGYRKVDLAPDECLISIVVPFTRQFEYVKEFKQAHRRDDDIAIVNAGVRIRVGLIDAETASPSWIVQDASIAFGGVAAKTLLAPKTAAALVGKPLNSDTLCAALNAVKEDVTISADAPGGMVEYRRALAASFVLKGVIAAAVALEADENVSSYTYTFDESYRSAVYTYSRPVSQGMQYTTPGEHGALVGQPYRHAAADMQVTGEALYADDIASPPRCLHAALVLSTRPHARLKSVDATLAEAMPGVEGVFTAKDVPGDNMVGPIIHDEYLFADGSVTHVGQVIGVAVADSEAAARSAARAVAIEYEDILPAILDIDDAIKAGSFYDEWTHSIAGGDVDTAFSLAGHRASGTAGGGVDGGCEHVLEGEVKLGGQEHFYLEPNACLVIPGENEEILTWSSTQCPDKHQRMIADVLSIPHNKVVVKTKRLGGGFGGKETRAAFFNAIAAVPAYLLRRTVRLVLDRDEDMAITGQRHPYRGRYKIGFSSDGTFIAYDVAFFSNAGNSLDLSASVMDRTLISCDSGYKFPNLRAVGTLCRTNMPSNTAFRGFGGPQGMAVTEHMVDKVSRFLRIAPEVVRERNLYREGEMTPYGMALEGCRARACWEGAVASAGGMEARRTAAKEFNATSRYRKRGIAAIPTKFGISFTTKFLNQAGALIHIYQGDATVLVAHGGVEMGQGLHTKVCQLVAQTLGVPFSSVFVSETSTDKVPNASPTAASASSDMYGAAAVDACNQLNARLAPYKEKMPAATFKEIVQAAYLDRIDLSAHGFYATPDITGFGGPRPFNYLTYGAALTEVELDTLTGDWQVLRSDIVMDVGQSLNPALDIGQIEGGFIQGMGWSAIEEVIWGDKEHAWVRPGHLFTRGPGTYKIPTANDIPIDFRVTLLRDSPCSQTPMVHSSKAVGEPPFFLGTSVFWALKDAVYAAREDAGCDEWFQLDLPATPERLRMACADEVLEGIAAPDLRPKMSC